MIFGDGSCDVVVDDRRKLVLNSWHNDGATAVLDDVKLDREGDAERVRRKAVDESIMVDERWCSELRVERRTISKKIYR